MKKDDSVIKAGFLRTIFDFARFRYHLPFDIAVFVACQAALESDYGRSDLAVSHFNYFGMKYPNSRYSMALGSTDNGFSVYSSMHNCVADYMARQVYFGLKKSDLKSVEKYAQFLKKSGYCSEVYYIDNIMRIYKQYHPYFQKIYSI